MEAIELERRHSSSKPLPPVDPPPTHLLDPEDPGRSDHDSAKQEDELLAGYTSAPWNYVAVLIVVITMSIGPVLYTHEVKLAIVVWIASWLLLLGVVIAETVGHHIPV